MLAPAAKSGPLLPVDAEVQVHTNGVDEDSHSFLCEDFELSEKQILVFVRSASEILPRQMHDEYDYLPCWVRGKITSKTGLVEFEIRAGGTGKLRMPSGEYILIGCKTCLKGF